MAELKVKCPTCQTDVVWSSINEFRPFCSERCKLIDLGEWASGNRFIASDKDHDDATAADLDRD
ncbi:MAG: DNA gyrase inhibitor YacG [Pseudomonadales bacterium]|nr:DNA gyrase inhibitor YacG [Pseudomonadales bacterium]